MLLGSIRSATVLLSRTASMVGTEYVRVPATYFQSARHLGEVRREGERRDAPVSSKTMTASETVVLVTPASVDAAPIMAHCDPDPDTESARARDEGERA